jgi:hypothetical protein
MSTHEHVRPRRSTGSFAIQLSLPELAGIMSEVIAVLRRVPGVSAELDRRAGRFPLR